MNILVLRGNPREEGHTQAVTDRVVRGMESEGGSIKDIRLFDKRINRCRGCFKCWYAHKGRCVFRDDMDDLLPALYNADLVFIATPLYHFTMSPSLSDFLNRTLPVTANGFTINGNSNLTNMPTDPERWEGKSLAYLSCAGIRGLEIFGGLRKSMELIADGLMMKLCGELLRPESYLLPFYFAAPATVTKINNSLELAGRQLVKQGYIEKGVQDSVSLPLIDSDQEYTELSAYYRFYAEKLRDESSNPERIADCVKRDTGFLMKKLEKYTDQRATARTNAVLLFRFSDTDTYWSVHINKGKTSVSNEKIENPDLLVTVDSRVWASIFLNEIDAREALTQNRIQLKGDKTLFMKFPRFFPPPNG